MIAELGGVVLRPLRPDDEPELRALELSDGNGARWRHGGEVPSPAEWRRRLWEGVLTQSVVVVGRDDRPAGLCVAYGADLRSGTAWLAVVGDQRLHGTGAGLLALGQFIDGLLDAWPLRQLYAEVDEANLVRFTQRLGEVAEPVGVLRAQLASGDERRDQHLLLIRREHFEQIVRPRLRHARAATLASSPAAGTRRGAEDELLALVADQLGRPVGDLDATTRFDELGIDSLGVVLLLADLDEAGWCFQERDGGQPPASPAELAATLVRPHDADAA